MSDSEFTDEVFDAWRVCHIFFLLVQYGWGKGVQTKPGTYVQRNSPVSRYARLGCPPRRKLFEASSLVRRTCGALATRYKEAWREYKEALERFSATRSKQAWQLYIGVGRGHWNRQAVCYQSHIALRRRGAMKAYRRRYRYLYNELLKRSEERQRARREMYEADRKLAELKDEIFAVMGVPKRYRRLSV